MSTDLVNDGSNISNHSFNTVDGRDDNTVDRGDHVVDYRVVSRKVGNGSLCGVDCGLENAVHSGDSIVNDLVSAKNIVDNLSRHVKKASAN